MRIAIVGYGKMGKMVHSLIEETRDAEVVAVIDPWSPSSEVTSLKVDEEALRNADVVIDFSDPACVIDNMIFYAHMGIPAVVGTTGWYKELDELRKGIEGYCSRIIYSGNFSLGVAMFLHIAEKAAALVDKVDAYDISLSEIHHREKADCPSGTLLMIAEKVLSNVGRKSGMVIGNPDGKIGKDKLQLASLRVGREPGTHVVTIDSAEDSIILEHRARTREGFARGAIKAASWLLSKPEGLYTMDDFIADLLGV